MGRFNRRVVDLTAIRRNFRALRDAAGAPVMPVIKADAYGHGLLPVARALSREGVPGFAVAIPEEGAALRAAGVAEPVLVLGPLTRREAADIVRDGLTQTVSAPDMVALLSREAEAQNRDATVHLKIDTGMNRTGVRTPAEVAAVLSALRDAPRVRLTGVFTHFADADADTPDGGVNAFTREQLRRFNALCAPLPRGLVRHAANSAAIARYPAARLDMARAGVSLYGCPPAPMPFHLTPALTWETEVAFVKEIAAGDTVSYGREFTAERPTRVATLPVGYGDGYPRSLCGRGAVLIGGALCPILGRVCMDQVMADVTRLPACAAGDSAVLLGRQGAREISADTLARWAGTISYEMLLAPTERVTRVWVGGEQP